MDELERQQAVAVTEVESAEVERLQREVACLDEQMVERNKVPVLIR